MWKVQRTTRLDLESMEGIIIADTPTRCEKVVKQLHGAKLVGVDTETHGHEVRKQHPIGLARCVSMQVAWRRPEDGELLKAFVPLWGKFEPNLRAFKRWLAVEEETKVLHNAKYDMHSLANHRTPMRGLKGDTLVMDYIHDTGEQFHGLKECIRRYFGENTQEYSDVFKEPKPLKRGGFSTSQTVIPSLLEVVQTHHGVRKLVKYATSDPEYTVRLYEYLDDKLRKTEWRKSLSYLDYYEQFELPFTATLYRMERRGCTLDVAYLEEMLVRVQAELEEAERWFYKACIKSGVSPLKLTDFNLGSGDQVGRLLEEDLGANIQARTPTGKVQTSDDVLEKIRAPLAKAPVKALLTWRNLRKLLTTYVEPLLECAGTYNGRVHTNFKQASVATMRLSSSAPNLQNIPTRAKDAFGIRAAFIARPGHVFADIDLSQIEMRLAAHFTGDELLIKAIRDGWDLHALTATKAEEAVRTWLGVRSVTPELLDEVKKLFPDERQRSKTLNFGCIAEGSPVLTHVGLIPIERVEDWHLVWDGVEWVHHEGCVFQGEKEVVTYDGLSATADHRVFTEDGELLPFGEAASGVRPRRLAVGEVAGVPVGYVGPVGLGGDEGPTPVRRGAVQRVCEDEVALGGQRQGAEDQDVQVSEPPEVPRPEGEDVGGEVRRDGAAVSEDDACVVAPLPGSGDQGSVRLQGALHSVGSEDVPRVDVQGSGLRSGGQQRALLAGESSVGDAIGESAQPKKVRVYDLLNAGPRHRFTVSGKIVHNCLYGMGPPGYAALTGVDEMTARTSLDSFWNGYPGLKRGVRSIQQGCAEKGYVRTLLGRFVRIPGIKSADHGLRAAAMRQAFNYTIQGSASDMMKMAMVLIDGDERLEQLGVKMTLQIHDELAFEIPEESAAEAKPIIEEYVSHPYRVWGFRDLLVDTPAEMGVGKNWQEAK